MCLHYLWSSLQQLMGDLKNQQSELIQILRAEHNKTSVQKWSIVNSFTAVNYWINLGYFLGNCPLTPPLSQDFALSEKYMSNYVCLGEG